MDLKERIIAGDEPGKPGAFAVLLEKFTFSFADSVITTSYLAAEEIKKWVNRAKVKVIQFGVDLEAFSHINTSKNLHSKKSVKNSENIYYITHLEELTPLSYKIDLIFYLKKTKIIIFITFVILIHKL